MQRFTIVSVLLLAGCGGTEVRQVTGSVLLDGTPLPHASVVFYPARDVRLGLMVQEKIADDGTFDIRPNYDQGQGKPGDYIVLVGDYEAKALIMGVILTGGTQPMLPEGKRLARLRYWKKETSPLRATVVSGVNHLDPFELETPPGPFLQKPTK